MEIDKELFRKKFPHLARDMEGGETEESTLSILPDIETEEKVVPDRFDGYDPGVVDFLRRCDNEQQAEEVIRHLEKRGEISREYAAKLMEQLQTKGVRSFGPKKEDNHYLKQVGCR